jgi:hypothetical protein
MVRFALAVRRGGFDFGAGNGVLLLIPALVLAPQAANIP